ncbi:BPTD_3080 family restriction endonuclease [Edaphobacter modestus]|uniref:Type III restriction enzyme n=1 Tax=Edaphobacter modestus TaxID=388466 RepID=A0A4Q7YU08_9BACT|nr:DEAD/DEAH box helicase family protein [Edaphobacter modestus]RZU41088.1 type III restriction enzyme [Edaphobacter modestus]
MQVENPFFEHPILNSPYAQPACHWELDASGQPSQRVIQTRRRAEFITPIPKPKKRKGEGTQEDIVFDEGGGLSTPDQRYAPIPFIDELRADVDAWRGLPNPDDWLVNPETRRLLQHWRHYQFNGVRPFFCQVEAAETIIWLTEVAPKRGKKYLEHLKLVNQEANPELLRIALKLATGAGKTTVMAMIIAWQTVNAVRHPNSQFTRGFLVVAPGLTIKDRLRVLQPNDPDNYYANRELVPTDMLLDIQRAEIVVENFHKFKLQERLDVSKGGKALLRGRYGPELKTTETEGQMVQRVAQSLMGIKNILVINDEAHHCYRERVKNRVDEELSRDEEEEAKKNAEAARVWISGLEAVKRQLGISKVIDLSATPFFLHGSGYREGTLFPWTMSDFSLMDAIESGIVKLPRVPVADNVPGGEMPKFRNLWQHVGKDLSKKGRGKAGVLDPQNIPATLVSAIHALYGHYVKTFEAWERAEMDVPPCFIFVCNNTSTSKLVYDFVSGFFRDSDTESRLVPGHLPLFRNFDEYDQPLARPRTLLIDSEQLESGEALDEGFRKAAAVEIEQFRREKIERSGEQVRAEEMDDVELLREVMNTVGKKGKLGEQVRCVVSVSMLTEGWDANTVTHVLGVRAFGTQLLCEQVIGRALRRESYDLNSEGLFDAKYADILGIPFDFAASPVIAPPVAPRKTIQVKAVRPDRDYLEISFPRVQGYRVEPPEDKLDAIFTDESKLVLTPSLVGPTATTNSGIVGKGVELTVEHLGNIRYSTLIFQLTSWLLYSRWREAGEPAEPHLFPQLYNITRRWLDECLVCTGGTQKAQIMTGNLKDIACERITAAITRGTIPRSRIKIILDPFNQIGSTCHVNFATTKTERWDTGGATNPPRCHINWVILDSDWEAEFCRVAETHPRVRAYVKNHSLGFEVPYRRGSESKRYRPDFIVRIDDGHGDQDLLNLVVEIKGYRGEDAKDKKDAMETYWVPGVNNSGNYGRWAFAEFTSVYAIESEFISRVEGLFNGMIEDVLKAQPEVLAPQGQGA